MNRKYILNKSIFDRFYCTAQGFGISFSEHALACVTHDNAQKQRLVGIRLLLSRYSKLIYIIFRSEGEMFFRVEEGV